MIALDASQKGKIPLGAQTALSQEDETATIKPLTVKDNGRVNWSASIICKGNNESTAEQQYFDCCTAVDPVFIACN